MTILRLANLLARQILAQAGLQQRQVAVFRFLQQRIYRLRFVGFKAVNVQRGTNDMSDVHVYDVLRGKWMVDDESELPAPLRNIGKDAK